MMKKYDRTLLKFRTVREAKLYERLANGKVRCKLCARTCTITEGNAGFCRTRVNLDNKLYTLVYGDLSAIESRPIEIKPFFHYYPGSSALTFSTWSCNFRCAWCQNYHLSQQSPEPTNAIYTSPESIIARTQKAGDQGVCISFQEPTLLFEYALDVFTLTKNLSLYCCFVSNGYMSIEALRLLVDAGLSGLKIDIKGDAEVYKTYCKNVDVEHVWKVAHEAKKLGIHVELVCLVVTDVNDSDTTLRAIIERHIKEVGTDTPLHFTRYHPDYQFTNPPTPIERLTFAYELAKSLALNFPYVGNLPGHPYEHTYCPNCKRAVLKRFGYQLIANKLTSDNRCQYCNYQLPIVGYSVISN